MIEFISAISIIIITCIFLYILWRYHISKLSFLPAPPTVPWIGTSPFFNRKPHTFFHQMLSYAKQYDTFTLWLLHWPIILSRTVEYSEVILSSKELVQKSKAYNFLHDWLGTGLLTSHGSKWKKRRRLITPTFHFNILNDFVGIFIQQATCLVLKLKLEIGQPVDIQLPVCLAALDVICETAMGVKINTQQDTTSEYARAVCSMNSHLQHRQKCPWLWPTFIYKYTSSGRSFYKDLKVLHDFTMTVINKRIESRKYSNRTNDDLKAHKKVFLDMLLDLYDKGELDIEGIREEVDTFMFEGHDTTSAGLSWILYSIGRNPHIQDRLHAEIDEINKSSGSLIDKLRGCKYLENVIKEGLRMHPPIGSLARTLHQDTKIDGHVIPAGTEVSIFVHALHNNPKYWEEPEKFNPDRFSDEEFFKRNPYCYIPFSAGPRNCIGQKYAMLSEKIFLYHIMSMFQVVSLQREKEVEDCFEVIHRSTNGIMLLLYSR